MSETVILGGGLAGLTVALALAPMKVTLVSPCALGEGCSSAWAQGGLAASVGDDDSPALHTHDTIAAGAGINDAAIVRQVTQDAAKIVERLRQTGVPFDCNAQGRLSLGLEAAHSRRRIVRAKDATGAAVTQTLIRAARATPSITFIENATASDLIVNEGETVGVVLNVRGKEAALAAPNVVLATGGAAGLWRDTTNPHENWGGGLALAARAGAALADLEFLQFHPTAIALGRDPMPLASESLRGEGCTLIDETGARFTDELQSRDIVARAIAAHIAAGHRVFLDARQALGSKFRNCFPTVFGICESAGIDPATTPIPVCPAAHYHMGGVAVDARGRTELRGLWACGEAACTGLHGANRLASNSLLEAASFGTRVAADILNGAFASHAPSPAAQPTNAPRPCPPEDAQRIRAIMSDSVGVVRDRAGLESAVAALRPLAARSDKGLVGMMIARTALRREESRGAHYRRDFPTPSPQATRSRLVLRNGEIEITHPPAPANGPDMNGEEK